MAWGISGRKYAFATPIDRAETRTKSGKIGNWMRVGIFLSVAITRVL